MIWIVSKDEVQAEKQKIRQEDVTEAERPLYTISHFDVPSIPRGTSDVLKDSSFLLSNNIIHQP